MVSDSNLGLHSCDSTAKQKLCVAQRHFVKYDVCGAIAKEVGAVNKQSPWNMSRQG